MDSTSEPTNFINVDLDLTGAQSLAPLLEAWDDDVIVLHHTVDDDGETAGVESSKMIHDVDENIMDFVGLVRGLSPELRALWSGLARRTFDVGVQAGDHPRYWCFELAPATLAAIAEVGARLVCTVYAPVHDDETTVK